MIPQALKKYFWDTDFSELNLKKHKAYILERILELGDEEAVRWLKKTFTKKEIMECVEHSRRISEVSKNFWRLVLGQR